MSKIPVVNVEDVSKDNEHLPFFAREPEECSVAASLLDEGVLVRGKTPSFDQALSVWEHVRGCFTCLRNTARMAFLLNGGGLPMPVVVPEPMRAARRAYELASAAANDNDGKPVDPTKVKAN